MKPQIILSIFLFINHFGFAITHKNFIEIDSNRNRIHFQSTTKMEEWTFLNAIHSTPKESAILKEAYLNIQLNNQFLWKSKPANHEYTSLNFSVSYLKPITTNRKGFTSINLAVKKCYSLNEKATNVLAMRLGLSYYFQSAKLYMGDLTWEQPKRNRYIRGPQMVEVQLQSVLYANFDLRHQLGQINLPIFKNAQLGLFEHFDGCFLDRQFQYSIGVGIFVQSKNHKTVSITLIKKKNQNTILSFRTGFFF